MGTNQCICIAFADRILVEHPAICLNRPTIAQPAAGGLGVDPVAGGEEQAAVAVAALARRLEEADSPPELRRSSLSPKGGLFRANISKCAWHIRSSNVVRCSVG